MNRIQGSAELLAQTLVSKNADYAPGDEFSNFEAAAEFAKTDVVTTLLTQIAIKYTRIDNLTNKEELPENESLADSLLDLAGYAVIAHAYLTRGRSGVYENVVPLRPVPGKDGLCYDDEGREWIWNSAFGDYQLR